MVEFVELGLDFNSFNGIGNGLLKFLDLGNQFSLLSRGHRGSFNASVQLGDLGLNLFRILHLLSVGKVLKELLLLQVKGIDLFNNCILVLVVSVLLLAKFLNFLNLLVQSFSEGELRATHFAAIASLLLLSEDLIDLIANGLDLSVKFLHLLFEFLLARLLLSLVLGDYGRDLSLQSDNHLFKLGSRSVMELVHPGVLVKILAGCTVGTITASVTTLGTYLVALSSALLASLIVGLVLEIATSASASSCLGSISGSGASLASTTTAVATTTAFTSGGLLIASLYFLLVDLIAARLLLI